MRWFGLTGVGVLVLAALLLVAVSAATLAWWARLERTGRARWPLRAGLLVLSQLTAILVTALLLNDSFTFYQSWGELLGVQHRQARPAAAPDALTLPTRVELAAHARHGVGTIVTLPVAGSFSGVQAGPAIVYLPPQYGDPAYAARTFPVVELLDGFPGSPTTWLHAMHLQTVLDSLIDTGRSTPFIAVLPVQNVALPRDTECVNVAGGPRVDTYLSYDVRAAVERSLRAARSGAQWTVMGYSTGGYCASDLALQHPQLFTAAVSIAGYNAPAHDSTTHNLFGTHPVLAEQYSPLWLVQHRSLNSVHLLLINSKGDRAAYRASLQFAAAAHGRLQLQTLTLPHGGHNFATFSAELPTAFGWLSRYVAGPLAPLPTVDGLAPSTPAGPNSPPGGTDGQPHRRVQAARATG